MLSEGLITSILARKGHRRWCEFATASAAAAGTFLQLYPHTRFLCLHRACPDVIYDALHASPWGLAGSAFAPFTAEYPGSAVAALTAYWIARAGPLIALEEGHRDACCRIRHEDLVTDPRGDSIFAFLGLPALGSGTTTWTDTEPSDPPDSDGHRTPIPVEQIPASLLEQANDLARRIGYPPLAPSA
jgi:hypothetical protein